MQDKLQNKMKKKRKREKNMKKGLKLLLVISLCLAFTMITGCSSDKDDLYAGLDYDELVTLPDYDEYTVEPIEVNITDSKIDAEIDERLEAAATEKEVTEGTVEEGDTVTISYEGTLEDGTSTDGMKSDSYTLTLGSGNMIDGFEEGIYGAKIGETLTLDLEFPDPYTTNEDLSGKAVTFKVKVLNKKVSEKATLNEEFVKENSEATTVEEYRKLVADELEKEEYTDIENNRKSELFQQIADNAEVTSVPDEIVEYEKTTCTETYQQMCENYGYTWDEFLEGMQMTQEEFDEQLEIYAEQMAKYKMVAYAIAEKEGVSVKQKEVIENLLSLAGADSKDAFEESYGVTPEEYAKTYNSYGMKVSMLLDESLQKIYERLSK